MLLFKIADRVGSAVLGCVFFVYAAIAQESVPADPIAALKPVMMELQKGAWSPDAARNVIETLIANQHEAAASWWTSLADEAVKNKKLPTSVDGTLRALRKKSELEGASADDRKLAAKVVRHLESLVASKNFDEAKRIAQMVKVLVAVAPDAATARALEAAEKKIAAGGNQDPSNLPRQQKQFAEIQEAVLSTIKTRVERLLAEFRAAGCKPGRLFLKSVIKNATPVVGDPQARSWHLDLGKAARLVEPTRTLSIFLRPLREVRGFRDGEEIGPMDREPVELQVLGGDLLQFRIPPCSRQTEKLAFHVVAVSARLDGKDLDIKRWFVNKASDPALIDPPVQGTGIVRVPANDARLKEIDLKPPPVRGGFIASDDDRVVAVGVNEECAAAEKEFEERKLRLLWLGTFGEGCVLVLKVPDG